MKFHYAFLVSLVWVAPFYNDVMFANDQGDVSAPQPSTVPEGSVSSGPGSLLNAEFSMAGVESLKLRGGSFWSGFYSYSIDLKNLSINAVWNNFDYPGRGHRSEGAITIDESQAMTIASAVEGLRYHELAANEEECSVMADGDEASITLLKTNKTSTSFYPLRSWPSRCQGLPLSDESFVDLERVVFNLLPKPVPEPVAD